MRMSCLGFSILATSLAALVPCAATLQSTETVIVEGHRFQPSPDACLTVADAIVREWAQNRLQRDRTDTLADGKVRTTQLIFTENTVFQLVEGFWRTGPATRGQRSTGSAQDVIKRMDLSDCSVGGDEEVNGQKAAVYAYAQKPDTKAEIWISKATELPLRIDVEQSAKKPDQPVKISMNFVYDDDVHVPLDAEHRDYRRMLASQDWMRKMQMRKYQP
jgi:hypothetical protein